MARTVQCIKLGQESEGLDFPPYPGELGKRIDDGQMRHVFGIGAINGGDVLEGVKIVAP